MRKTAIIFFEAEFGKLLCNLSRLCGKLGASFVELKNGLHIVVSDGDVPASTGRWRRCIGGHSQKLNWSQISHLDWDVGDTTGTSAASQENVPISS